MALAAAGPSSPFTTDTTALAQLLMRPLSPAEQAAALRLLGQAAARIEAAVPSVRERVETGTLAAGLVQDVQTAMVLRVLRNPDGMRQETEGPFSYTRDNTLSTGQLYLADAELALLAPAQARLGVGTIRLGHAL